MTRGVQSDRRGGMAFFHAPTIAQVGVKANGNEGAGVSDPGPLGARVGVAAGAEGFNT